MLYPKTMRAGQVFSLSIQVFDLVKKLDVSASLSAAASNASADKKFAHFEKGMFWI